MGFLNLDIKIYSDQDVDIKFYQNLKEDEPFIKNDTIEIYYNKLGKDCGTRADEIDVTKTII